MASTESALVLVQPDDTVEAIAEKVRRTGASSVELLISDGTAALLARGAFTALRMSLERERVSLLVISSDTQILEAARQSRLDTVGVEGARVTVPPASAATPRDQARVTKPIDTRDAEFLKNLDSSPARNRYSELREEDADLYAAFDELSDTIQDSSPVGRRSPSDSDLAAALDDFSAAAVDDQRSVRRRGHTEEQADSSDEQRRQSERRRETQQRSDTDGRETAGRRYTAADFAVEEPPKAKVRRRSPIILLVVVIVLVLLLLAVVWAATARATVVITPPVGQANEQPFTGEVIPYTPETPAQNAPAVQANAVTAEAEFMVQGRVNSETLSPVGRAKGAVTIINTIEQAITLPEGTEFLGKNPGDQDVRFTLDQPATIPGATTTTSLTGRSTTYGQADVAVTARSAGSASNVAENAIKQILIPGQQPIVSDSSNFLIRHQSIAGGTEEPQRIVTEADVQAVLGEALTGLYNAGVQRLREKIDEQRLTVDGTTITPNTEDLARPESYDPPVVNPSIGQPVDSNNPVFSITVKTRFSALATPRGRLVSKQLETIVPEHFNQRSTPVCKASETPLTSVAGWNWDGAKLTINGVVTCQPKNGLAPETIGKVRNAVLGKSREEADVALRALQDQGLIGVYQLPDKAQFSGIDLLLDVRVGEQAPRQ